MSSLLSLLLRLWRHLPFKRKLQMSLVMLLSTFASALEVLSIGLVIPFLGALLEPARLSAHAQIGPLLRAIGADSVQEVVATLTLLFCFVAIISGGVRLILMWIQTKLSYASGEDFALGIYRRALNRTYADHLRTSSSEIISAVSVKSEIVVRQTLFPVLTILSSAITAIAIFALLFFAHPAITIGTIATFGAIYFLINQVTKKRLSDASVVVDSQSSKVIKALQEGLGSIRDIIIDGSQSSHVRAFSAADQPLRRARASVQIISQAPRYIMETGGLVFLGSLAFFLSAKGSFSDSLPALGVLALGVQRLLPVLQQAYAGWACVGGTQQSLETILNFLDEPLPQTSGVAKAMQFVSNISIEDVSFRYEEAKSEVLKGVSFHIPKGARVGIVGLTGSGKSTLLDIFMGLLKPTNGAIRVDGIAVDFSDPRSWHALISHVPQSIFLADATIKENIAFGVPVSAIDRDRLLRCAAKAQMLEFVESLPLGFDTVVGERGAWLSGGQRQRLGIARALYKSAQVIVLDEATSALDDRTEASVMKAIEELGAEVTVVMVAHRTSTLSSCQQIIELRDGRVHRSTSYAEFSQSMRDPLV